MHRHTILTKHEHRRGRWVLGAAATTLGLLAFGLLIYPGCRSDPVVAPAGDADRAVYLELEGPEDVVADLVLAYRNRDIEAYSRLLAPEFVFRFQPGDVREVGRESWGRDEEVEATRRLFSAQEVEKIELDLTWAPAEPATEPGLEHTMRVRVTAMLLRVTERSGTVYQVDGDVQHFYLRPERENSAQWVIAEWWDLPGPARGMMGR